MNALEASWYNAALPGSRAMSPLEESSSLPLYEAAADLIDTSLPVVDLGCGTGRFAELLRRRGVQTYAGLDFAADAIDEARRYCRAPGFSFHVADLRTAPLMFISATYVLLEVLEHLDDDRGLLARLRRGAPIVISVPDFWSASHVRVFPQVAAAVERYKESVFVTYSKTMSFPGSDNLIHLIKGVTI